MEKNSKSGKLKAIQQVLDKFSICGLQNIISH